MIGHSKLDWRSLKQKVLLNVESRLEKKRCPEHLPKTTRMIKYLLGKASFMFVVSGLVIIAAGIAVFIWPVEEFTPLVYLFGIPAIVQGLAHIYAATYKRSMCDLWWVLLLVGIVYLTAGVITISYPDVTHVFLMSAISAAWSFTGAMMILLSIQLHKELENGSEFLLSGILSLVAGAYLLTNLQNNAYSIVWVVVSYSFLIGMLTIFFGIKAKAWTYFYFDDRME